MILRIRQHVATADNTGHAILQILDITCAITIQLYIACNLLQKQIQGMVRTAGVLSESFPFLDSFLESSLCM